MADNKSMQVCHCGWSKHTTYHGLRTHQGKMGCTPKGSASPNMAQIIFNTYMPKLTYNPPPFELQRPDGFVHYFDENTGIPRQILDELVRFQDQKQKELTFLSFTNQHEDASPPMFHSGTVEEPGLPAADIFQTQTMVFGAQPKPALADVTVKKENKPLFGTAQQPLQSSDHSNKTRSALDSIIGAQQPAFPFVNQASTSQSTAFHMSIDSSGKENKPLLPSPQVSSQSLPRTQEFVQTRAPETYSIWRNVAPPAEEETNQLFTAPTFAGSTSQETFACNGKQQPVIKPATFSGHPIASNTGEASMAENFGTTLPSFSMFGSNNQSQSSFGWATSAQQFQMTKPEPPPAQTAASSLTRPLETKSTSLLQGLLMSDGALQQQRLDAKPATTQENKPNFGSPQSPSASDQTQSATSSTFAQQSLSQIFITQPGPKTPDVALKEHKPLFSSKSSTKLTGAQQVGSADGAQSKPATPKTALQQENKQFFETPQLSHQPLAEGTKTRRALDFSTGAAQAQASMIIPTTTSQTTLPPVDNTQEAEKQRQIQKNRIKAELQQKIRSREQKLSEIRSCAKACKGRLDEEWLEINSVFSDVIHVVEEARQRALQPLENRKEKLKRESQTLIKKIQEDIEKLEKAIEEVDGADDLDVSPLSKLKVKDFSKWNVNTSFSFGTLQSTLSVMVEQIQDELEKFAALELERASAFAVDVKLDSSTAHHWLVVSRDGKKVQDGGQSQAQQLPLAVGKFDMHGSILASDQFSSGRAYWEVQVGAKSGWDLGVASAQANRKGRLTLNPENGYWAIVHFEGEKYAALTAPPVCLQLKEKPQKVGVFVDYEEGLVSFYNVRNQSHIYSFTKCSFDNGIFPYFSPHLTQNGKNSEPLVLTSVEN